MTDTFDTGSSTDGSLPTTDPVTLQAALDAKRALLEAMTPADLVNLRGLDPETAVTNANGSLARIGEHRDEIVAKFGDEGGALVDDLPNVINAVRQATLELAWADSPGYLAALHAEVLDAHQLLITDADSLANRKLLERPLVDGARPIQGYRTAANSTLALVALFRASWRAVADKTPITIADVDRAERVARNMIDRLDAREVGGAHVPASELRARALSLLVKTYGEVRRMMQYVRFWQDDADQIAPSLWANRRGSKSRSGGATVVPPVDPAAPDAGGDVPTPPADAPVVATGPSAGSSPFTS